MGDVANSPERKPFDARVNTKKKNLLRFHHPHEEHLSVYNESPRVTQTHNSMVSVVISPFSPPHCNVLPMIPKLSDFNEYDLR